MNITDSYMQPGGDPENALRLRLSNLVLSPDLTDDQMHALTDKAIALKSQHATAIALKNKASAAQKAYDGFVAALTGLDKTYCAQQFNCTTDFVVATLQTLVVRNQQKVAVIQGMYQDSISLPKPGFTAPATATANAPVQFTDSSSGAPFGWQWEFGDGGTSTDQNPSHTYAAAGDYTVSLVAVNIVGTSDPVTTLVTVS